MIFLKVDKEDSKNAIFNFNPDYEEFLTIYPAYYDKVGYDPPWIGYFVANENREIIGCAAFKGMPINNQVEIAYGVFHRSKDLGLVVLFVEN